MAMSKVDLTVGLPIGYARTHMQTPPPITLRQLAVGDHATIVGYERGARALRDKLLALGLTRGTQVTIVRAGVTGCPIELHARGTKLVLRRTEAAALHVERLGGGHR